jgi:hypothetical protein
MLITRPKRDPTCGYVPDLELINSSLGQQYTDSASKVDASIPVHNRLHRNSQLTYFRCLIINWLKFKINKPKPTLQTWPRDMRPPLNTASPISAAPARNPTSNEGHLITITALLGNYHTKTIDPWCFDKHT